MKKYFRFVISIIVALVSSVLCLGATACGSTPQEDIGAKAEPYPEDFVCGYFLTFYDGEKAVTSESLSSYDAVKNYFYKHKNSGGYSTYSVTGLAVAENFMTIDGLPLSPDAGGKVKISDKFYYTSDMAAKTFKLRVVNYNYETGEAYASDCVSNSSLSGTMTLHFGNDMSAKVEKDGELKTVTYEIDGSITFIKTNKLVEIDFSEFNANDERISRTAVTDLDKLTEFTATDSAEYVIVEKKYEEGNGSVYSERSVYSRGKEGSERIYVPYGNGLTKPADLKINFDNREGQL